MVRLLLLVEHRGREAREYVMKNQERANNRNDVNDPTVANDPQDRVDDLRVSPEQEKRVKGGTIVAVNGGGNTPQGFVNQTQVDFQFYSR